MPKKVWWSGVAYLPGKHLLYAANRGTGLGPSNVVVFDARTRQIVTRIPVEINPYATVLSKDGRRLFVSNWASESVSVIDTAANKVIRTLHVGMNPNDMKLGHGWPPVCLLFERQHDSRHRCQHAGSCRAHLHNADAARAGRLNAGCHRD